MVLCVDEKRQVQALNRAQPILPLAQGVPARQSHDYERHGVTSQFAALKRGYLRERNRDPKPFVWTADADLILSKLQGLSKRISDSGH